MKRKQADDDNEQPKKKIIATQQKLNYHPLCNKAAKLAGIIDCEWTHMLIPREESANSHTIIYRSNKPDVIRNLIDACKDSFVVIDNGKDAFSKIVVAGTTKNSIIPKPESIVGNMVIKVNEGEHKSLDNSVQAKPCGTHKIQMAKFKTIFKFYATFANEHKYDWMLEYVPKNMDSGVKMIRYFSTDARLFYNIRAKKKPFFEVYDDENGTYYKTLKLDQAYRNANSPMSQRNDSCWEFNIRDGDTAPVELIMPK